MSEFRDFNLQPVSATSAQSAVERIFGNGPEPDKARYREYINRLTISRPSFVDAVDYLGIMRTMQGVVTKDRRNYSAGAALYYGAIQAHAKEHGVGSPKVKQDALQHVVLNQFSDISGRRAFNDLIHLYSGIEPVQNALQTRYEAGSVDQAFSEFFDRSGGRDTEAQVLVFDEHADENLAVLERAHEAGNRGLALHMSRFMDIEVEFVDVMTGTWWNTERSDKTAIEQQQIGSVDAFQLVEAALATLH
jgi:hypothetical protein